MTGDVMDAAPPLDPRGYLTGLAVGLRCQAIPLAEAYGDTRAVAALSEMLAETARLLHETDRLEAQRVQLMQLAAAPSTPAKH